MALLDVAFLCDDPDFASTFTIVRSTGDVNGFGEYEAMASGQIPGIGVVFPATPETLARLADGSNLNGAIEIWTRLRLVASSGRDELDADRILWNGKPYTVLEVSAYGAWGDGFHHVVARLAALNPS